MKTFSALTLIWTSAALTACATATPRHEEPVEPTALGTADIVEAPLAPHPEPPAAPTPREPSPPRLPIVLMTPMQDGHATSAKLSTLVPGQKPSPLKVRVGQECGDTMGIGSSSPVVSPDGRFVAFNDLRKGANFRGELVVASLTDKEPVIETLTQHKGDLDVCVQITGWSADGQRLLY
ncbi:MAG TPA: hypothetical protein PK095_09425, partial [Myxococcota bacterium]|nr:hypothetical protein [Myxococcota bacterium]